MYNHPIRLKPAISKGSALRIMTQKKTQLGCKSIALLGAFLGAAIVSNASAFAAQPLQTLDSEATSVNQVAGLDVTAPVVPADQAAPTEQVVPTEQTAPTGQTAPVEQNLQTAPAEKAGTTPEAKPAPGNSVSQASLSDVSGNWAEPFIRVLTEKGIIAGYPDGTFQPDRLVTRAEFAALVNKAFPDAPTVREAINFRDVPRRFWAANAIQRASATGFLAGYGNGTFLPGDNIKRIDSVVSFINGSKLAGEGQPVNIDELFTDTNQVPTYGRDELIAAAQRCVAVSVTFPDGKNFNPNGAATRADVAAFLHQTLVATGRLPKLAADSPAQKYIANCSQVAVAKITEQDVLGRTGIPAVPAVQQGTAAAPVNAPVGGIAVPSAFGANWGDAFIGFGTQNNIPALGQGSPRVTGRDATTVGAGFGIGDARNAVGLETSYTTSGSFGNRLFNQSGVNFKLHKVLADNVAVAVGWDNAIRSGYNATNDPGSTVYGVVTGVMPIGDTSNITASVGLGNGRFRNSREILLDKQSTNLFGSLGFRVSENIALVGDYNGRNFDLGLPLTLKLSDGVGVQVTPSLLDVGNNNVSGSRFGLSGGLGIKF
jgi:S-layer homology domain